MSPKVPSHPGPLPSKPPPSPLCVPGVPSASPGSPQCPPGPPSPCPLHPCVPPVPSTSPKVPLHPGASLPRPPQCPFCVPRVPQSLPPPSPDVVVPRATHRRAGGSASRTWGCGSRSRTWGSASRTWGCARRQTSSRPGAVSPCGDTRVSGDGDTVPGGGRGPPKRAPLTCAGVIHPQGRPWPKRGHPDSSGVSEGHPDPNVPVPPPLLTRWSGAGGPPRWSGRWSAAPRGPSTPWRPLPPQCSLRGGMGAQGGGSGHPQGPLPCLGGDKRAPSALLEGTHLCRVLGRCAPSAR